MIYTVTLVAIFGSFIVQISRLMSETVSDVTKVIELVNDYDIMIANKCSNIKSLNLSETSEMCIEFKF